MPVIRYDVDIPKLAPDALAAWAEIPAAVASDCLARGQAMSGAVSPLAPTIDTRRSRIGSASALRTEARSAASSSARVSVKIGVQQSGSMGFIVPGMHRWPSMGRFARS